jgi:hypothetical protein
MILEAVMKKILLTAAALTLGTSAHAWAPTDKAAQADAAGWQAGAADMTDGEGMSWAGIEMKSKEMVGGGATASADGMGAAKAAGTEWSGGKDMAADGAVSWAGIDMKAKEAVGGVLMASAESWTGEKSAAQDAVSWAGVDMKTKDAVGGAATASAGAGASLGMGGPDEAQGYPACRPGRGDDRCIQLYERGVHQRLAAWKASDGPAMGGPLEPAADGAKPAATAESADAAGPKVADDGPADMAAADGAKPATADEHAGHDMSGGAKPPSAASPNGGNFSK